MEDWLFRDPDDDPDRSGDPDPSIETIVAAFRKAVGRKHRPEEPSQPELAGSRRPGDERTREETGVEPEPSHRSGKETFEEKDEATSESSEESPSDIVQDTISAFRKVHRTGGEEPTPRGPEGPAPSKQTGRTERPEQQTPPSEDETEDTDFTLEDSIEEFAPDFREALERRGGPASGPVEDEPEEVEPTDRAGDTVPPSEEVEVSRGASTDRSRASSSERPSSERPSRPDESFLWVTDRPESDSTSVSIDHLSEPQAREAEAFLVEGDGARPYKILTHIRGHSEMSVYLKPVFWVHAVGEESKVSEHVDGEWARDGRSELEALRRQAATINRRIRNIAGSGGREDSGVELRVLRFMSTRGHEVVPHRTEKHSDGFVYPKLTPLLDRESRSSGGELTHVFSMLEDRRLVTGEFVMRQHACQNCGCAFLNFEEMCPHCGATDLETDELVHHFRCAFTGTLDEYKKEKGKLVCPKCDRNLKQIGVDYDKPSVVYTCQRCHEQFQDPEVQTTCYRCEHTNPPEQQIERQVKKYSITALGEETAVYGLSDSLLSILERESRLLDYATFQLIAESEAARIDRYQRSASSLLLVQVTGLRRLRSELGQRSEEVIEEIATAFDNTLRSSDYLSSRDESLYLFLLTETDKEGARRAGERLEQNIEAVLGQNLRHPPELNIAVQPLRPDIDLDHVADQFLTSKTGPRERATVNGR